MRLGSTVAAAALLTASLAAHADSLTYNFNYSGSSTYGLPGLSGEGQGSFTVSYTHGSSTGTLTAFSFTDTVGGDTVTYNLSNVSSSRINLTTGTSPTIATASIATGYTTGSNPFEGGVDFVLHDSAGTIADSTSGIDILADTSGGGSVSPASVATTPEPSSIALLGTGLLGVAGILRRRFLA